MASPSEKPVVESGASASHHGVAQREARGPTEPTSDSKERIEKLVVVSGASGGYLRDVKDLWGTPKVLVFEDLWGTTRHQAGTCSCPWQRPDQSDDQSKGAACSADAAGSGDVRLKEGAGFSTGYKRRAFELDPDDTWTWTGSPQ